MCTRGRTHAWQVAEMTGRKGRLLRDARGGAARYEQRTRSLQAEGHEGVTLEKVNLVERASFMRGDKLVPTTPATRCDRGCSPMRQRRQPDAIEAAATCDRRYNSMHEKVNAIEAAAPCDRGYNPM